jgi:hypothetical protein
MLDIERSIADLEAKPSLILPPDYDGQAWKELTAVKCRGLADKNACLNQEFDKRIEELTVRVDMKKQGR